MRILVADDDAGSRLVAQAAVQALGHECVTAHDGAAAWQLVQDFDPEVLVTDWEMPGLDGVQLCRAIRQSERDSYTYIILLTASADRAHVLEGMEAGADDYLTKPLEPFELQAGLLAASRVTTLYAELGRIRVQLAVQARIDPLTGLRNRLALREDLNLLHYNGERYQRSYGLALCDVDYFKPYNDSYGHQAGDAALRGVADALTAELRLGDTVYRYGGEEFLLLFPEQDVEGAVLAAHRIRRAILALCIEHSAGVPGGLLTVTFGVSAYQPGSASSTESLLAEADRALYHGKASGRNAVAASIHASAEDSPGIARRVVESRLDSLTRDGQEVVASG